MVERTHTADEKWLDFNVNYYVRVKLLPPGRRELRRQHDELKSQVPSIGVYEEPKEDAEGWSRWQLWSLMRNLGHLCVMGCPQPFETTIQIDTEQRA